MTTLQLRAKVTKYQKLKQLQDAINNLAVAPEGVSPLLAEALETLSTIIPQEHVFQAQNNWEVNP